MVLSPQRVTQGPKEIWYPICVTPTVLVSMVFHQVGCKIPLRPCVTLCTSNGAICGKYNFGKYIISPQAWWSHVVCHGEILSFLTKIFCLMQLWRSVLNNIGYQTEWEIYSNILKSFSLWKLVKLIIRCSIVERLSGYGLIEITGSK